eukprot:1717401-Amphidinium_carterae.1
MVGLSASKNHYQIQTCKPVSHTGRFRDCFGTNSKSHAQFGGRCNLFVVTALHVGDERSLPPLSFRFLLVQPNFKLLRLDLT